MVPEGFVSMATWLARHLLVMISVFLLAEEVASVEKCSLNGSSPSQSGEEEWAI